MANEPCPGDDWRCSVVRTIGVAIQGGILRVLLPGDDDELLTDLKLYERI
jgi:hypothetical protein